ncbi:MAG: hypothetical protein AB1710_05760 [Pseudomonadota bacterium]
MLPVDGSENSDRAARHLIGMAAPGHDVTALAGLAPVANHRLDSYALY